MLRIAVSPVQAGEWLEHSKRVPRRHELHPEKVARFCGLMRNGLFRGDDGSYAPVMLDADNFLIDGMHRLAAIVQYGQTVNLLVAIGFASPTAAHIRSRNLEE